MKTKHYLLTILALFANFMAKAADGDTFTANTTEGVTMTFKIISEDNLTVMVGDESMSDVSINPATSGSITIPSTVTNNEHTYTVTQLGYRAFHNCANLTAVTIPSTVTSFGQAVFARCTSLTTMNIPEGITRLNDEMFWGCTNLSSITLPSTLTIINEGVFYGCDNLTTVTVNATNPPGFIVTGTFDPFPNRANATINVPSGTKATYSAASIWRDCKKIHDPADFIEFESSSTKNCCVNKWDTNKDGNLSYAEAAAVTSIPDNAFNANDNMRSFEELKYFTNLTSIGSRAFYNCKNLTSISIPRNVTSIGTDAFGYSGSYTSSLSKTEFASIEAMCNIIYANSNANPIHYGDKHLLINGEEVTELVIPSSVTNINNYAFSNCAYLTSVTIPNSVTSIGDVAFNNCKNLTSVTIPNNVTSIGSYAFCSCYSLTSVTIPNSVTSIGSFAFSSCSSLPFVTIPNSVTEIGSNAFSNIYSVFFKSITPITYNNFLATYYFVPDETVDTYKTAWPSVADKIFGESDYALKSCTVTAKESSSALLEAIGGEDYTSRVFRLKVSGTINSYDMMIMRNKMINLTELDLSDATIVANSYNYGTGVSEDNVFPDFLIVSRLTSIILPNTITSIGQNALANCKCSSITIPASVTRIGSSAFSGASKLTSIEFAPSSQLTTIGPSAFASTGIRTFITPTSLQSIGPTAFSNCKNLTSFTFPEGMRTIGSYAFEDCSALTTIIFKEGVTSIGDCAFQNCTSLSSIALPQSLTTFERYVFSGCTNLESITIPSVKTIQQYTFNNCSALNNVKLSPQTTTIEQYAFKNCSALTEIHLPPFLKTIGNNAFSGCSKLMTIYAYMPDIITIGSGTFPNKATASLYVPAFLYNSYYYDTNWSQFLHVLRCDLQPGDYAAFYTNGDIIFEEGEQRITEDTPIAEIGNQGGVIVEGEAQQFDTVDQTVGDYSSSTATSASLIGDGETAQANNLPMNELRVNIPVTAKKWYFFCFPFDVTIENCTYPGRYVWRYYDGATRAANGSGGWKAVSGETLTAQTGYAFQSETAGTLVVKFSNPTFGGNRAKTLEAYAAQNTQHASWNLVGNPYSSYYDFRSEDITSPVTIWNGSSYVAYRPGDDECHLRPYEAFFIQKPNAADQISFNAGRRETYRQSENTKATRQVKRRENGITPERRLINLQIMSDTLMLDRTRVVLNQKAQRAYELECDAAKFMSDEAMAQLYSVEGGIQMAINERPLDGDIRLGYTAKKSGTLSISAPRMDLPMVLVDTKKNITFDLSVGTYDFDTQAGTFNDRFILRLGGETTAINNLAAKTGVCIGTQEGGIAIGGANDKTVNVYTIGGAQATQHNGNGFIALKSGVYVVNVDGVSAKVSVK
jgi:hypothetical protein